MKVKKLVIDIKSLKEVLQNVAKTIKDIEQGKSVRPQPETINFVSLEAARNFFTPKRIELLTLIHHQEPRSIYELAKMANRHLKNVQDDVAILVRVGLIGLEKKKESRGRNVPKVDYDKLDIRFRIAV